MKIQELAWIFMTSNDFVLATIQNWQQNATQMGVLRRTVFLVL